MGCELGLMSLRPYFVLCLGLWSGCWSQFAWAEAPARVLVVLSDTASTYREVTDAFVVALAGKFPVQTRLLGELRDNEIAAAHMDRILVVPVGVRAMEEIHGQSRNATSVLNLLAPRTASLTSGDAGSRDSAVYIDQPPERYLTFVKMLMPKAKRVGIVVSSDAVNGLRAYAVEAARMKLELVAEAVPEAQDVPRALQRMLPRVDVLLLVPDSEVVNENTVRHILIASYRQRTPVIGFSRGLTNAGAVASLVSSPAGIGRQGGLLAKQWNPAQGALPAARFAGDFDMTFNRQVARSLGIEVPMDERELSAWRSRLE